MVEVCFMRANAVITGFPVQSKILAVHPSVASTDILRVKMQTFRCDKIFCAKSLVISLNSHCRVSFATYHPSHFNTTFGSNHDRKRREQYRSPNGRKEAAL